MKKEKNVTNLLSNISKARDLLDEGDIKKIYKNQYFFEKLKNDKPFTVCSDSKHLLEYYQI